MRGGVEVELELGQRVRLGEEVVAEVIEGEAVLMDLRGNRLYTASGVGGHLLGRLRESCSGEELVEELVRHYEGAVSREQIVGDVLSFLRELDVRELIVVA